MFGVFAGATVDGVSILHQLRLVVFPIIYRVLTIPGGCLGFQNHQQYVSRSFTPQCSIVDQLKGGLPLTSGCLTVKPSNHVGLGDPTNSTRVVGESIETMDISLSQYPWASKYLLRSLDVYISISVLKVVIDRQFNMVKYNEIHDHAMVY